MCERTEPRYEAIRRHLRAVALRFERSGSDRSRLNSNDSGMLSPEWKTSLHVWHVYGARYI